MFLNVAPRYFKDSFEGTLQTERWSSSDQCLTHIFPYEQASTAHQILTAIDSEVLAATHTWPPQLKLNLG